MFEVAEQTGIPMPIYKMIESGKFAPDSEKSKVLGAFLEIDIK